jgi:hypothetical protein
MSGQVTLRIPLGASTSDAAVGVVGIASGSSAPAGSAVSARKRKQGRKLLPGNRDNARKTLLRIFDLSDIPAQPEFPVIMRVRGLRNGRSTAWRRQPYWLGARHEQVSSAENDGGMQEARETRRRGKSR